MTQEQYYNCPNSILETLNVRHSRCQKRCSAPGCCPRTVYVETRPFECDLLRINTNLRAKYYSIQISNRR